MKEDFDWISVATKKFHEYKAEVEKYTGGNEIARELALINGAKAVALSELLEMAGCKPEQ